MRAGAATLRRPAGVLGLDFSELAAQAAREGKLACHRAPAPLPPEAVPGPAALPRAPDWPRRARRRGDRAVPCVRTRSRRCCRAMDDHAPHSPLHAAADTPRAAPGMSARAAADLLGVHERTVRRWIDRGDLLATKDDAGVYHIADIELARYRAARAAGELHSDPGDAADRAPHAARQAAPGTGHAAAPAAPPTAVDLRPLVDHIAQLEGKVQQLTEAATVWQLRALQAEDRLKQLAAGPIAGDGPAQEAHVASPTRPGAAGTADAGSDASAPAGGTSRPWWRRWLGI